jgi:bifunctional non-homologous end joining protein LigD
MLGELEQPHPPFANPPTGYEAKGAHWVIPKLVAEVRFAEWTQEGILRQASFQGLRTQESPGEGPPGPADKTRRNQEPNRQRPVKGLRLTNPDRVLYPDIGLTKAGLVRYYEQIGDWMLPHVKGRPLTLVRCPEGYQKCFYQKHVNEKVPAAVGRIEIEDLHAGRVAGGAVGPRTDGCLGDSYMGVSQG